MTDLVPELDALPVFAILDGELCAFGPDGSPDFPLICEWPTPPAQSPALRGSLSPAPFG
jgi:hypothetical protein